MSNDQLLIRVEIVAKSTEIIFELYLLEAAAATAAAATAVPAGEEWIF